MLGAVIGGFLFNAFGVTSPTGGLLGAIIVAFIGAVVLLLLVRALRPRRL
jgi:uncharacterized membrane protein YeaQ/YmgE (transglycosylase-associated protein family)